ncbi:MAG: tyrosine-type recombinase/integrase [Cytophagales bacterium]|nr:tyrosine-type recombinase/integrase [Cytophagales bacterium]
MKNDKPQTKTNRRKTIQMFKKLFLQPLKNRKKFQWYEGQAHSKKVLGKWMKTLCDEAGIHNHSGRRSFCWRLVEIVGDVHQVAQLTGHKNVNSLKAYTGFTRNRLQNVHEALRQDVPPPKRQKLEIEVTTKAKDGTEEIMSLSQSSEEGEAEKGLSFLNNCTFGSGCNVNVTINTNKKK